MNILKRGFAAVGDLVENKIKIFFVPLLMV